LDSSGTDSSGDRMISDDSGRREKQQKITHLLPAQWVALYLKVYYLPAWHSIFASLTARYELSEKETA